jgi:predicted amidohydrolase YtcJ
VTVASLLAIAGSTVATQPVEIADVVLRGGRVITLDATDRVTEAIAVHGNRILAVGSNMEMQRLTGPKTRVVELQGRSLTPGFIDAHTHTEHTAEFLTFWVPIHRPPLTSTAAIIEKVRERVKAARPDARSDTQ